MWMSSTSTSAKLSIKCATEDGGGRNQGEVEGMDDGSVIGYREGGRRWW